MFGYLISFHYYAKTDLDELAHAAGVDDLTFLADSGAFSARHAGAEVTVERYAAWLKRWSHRLHAYASLDDLRSHRRSRTNLEALRALGLDPMPVFHVGEPLEVFDRCLGESDYLAVGGMVRASLTMRDPRLRRYLAELHERAARARVRLHGFGLSSWPMIKAFPWYSVDSSAAGSGYRYGRVMVYDPFADAWRTWALRDRKAWARWGWLVREYDMSPADFAGANTVIRTALINLAARSWSRAAKTLTGTRFYVSDTSAGDKSGPERLAPWQEGNEWATRVYVTDAALHQTEGAGKRIGAFEDGNAWETRVYLTDPHPSERKNLERLATWQEGNAWAGGDSAPQAARGGA